MIIHENPHLKSHRPPKGLIHSLDSISIMQDSFCFLMNSLAFFFSETYCTAPTQPQNSVPGGVYTTQQRVDFEASYQCTTGRFIDGRTTWSTTCQEDTTWSGTFSNCLRKSFFFRGKIMLFSQKAIRGSCLTR